MKVDPMSFLAGMHGRHGDTVFRRTADGKIVAQRRPIITKPATEGTKATRRTFSKGDDYWRNVVKANPELTAFYKAWAKEKNRNYRQMATRDFFHAPVINHISWRSYEVATGGEINIYTQDRFETLRMEVSVREGDGTVLFSGPAEFRHLAW